MGYMGIMTISFIFFAVIQYPVIQVPEHAATFRFPQNVEKSTTLKTIVYISQGH